MNSLSNTLVGDSIYSTRTLFLGSAQKKKKKLIQFILMKRYVFLVMTKGNNLHQAVWRINSLLDYLIVRKKNISPGLFF